MKSCLIIIKSNLFNNVNAIEGLRTAVGLSLSKGGLSILLIEDGVYLGLYNNPKTINMPEVETSFSMLEEIGIKISADEISLSERDINIQRRNIMKTSRTTCIALISTADNILTF